MASGIFGTGKPVLYKQTAGTAKNFTTDYAVDDAMIECTGHGLTAGDIITLSSTGSLPSGLQSGFYYSVSEVISSSQFTITAEGTNNATFTDNGTGTHSFTPYSSKVELPNFILSESLQEDGFFHKSVINGHKEWVSKGVHVNLEIKNYIYKEGTEASIRSKFKEIWGLRNTDLWVYKHIDGLNLFRDSSGDPVSFVIEDVQLGYLTQANFEDYMIIKLSSKDYVDFNNML
ncbi:hypothetical protein D6827_02685 [Candidatus Parcubacteria bacterium]|nr:MAG: hypothetical protein D6827_02685 [Candidatus Parcubacteria bacterium]